MDLHKHKQQHHIRHCLILLAHVVHFPGSIGRTNKHFHDFVREISKDVDQVIFLILLLFCPGFMYFNLALSSWSSSLLLRGASIPHLHYHTWIRAHHEVWAVVSAQVLGTYSELSPEALWKSEEDKCVCNFCVWSGELPDYGFSEVEFCLDRLGTHWEHHYIFDICFLNETTASMPNAFSFLPATRQSPKFY